MNEKRFKLRLNLQNKVITYQFEKDKKIYFLNAAMI